MNTKRGLSRRDFFKHSAIYSAIGLAPQFLTQAAHGEQPVIQGFDDGRILVVVQLSGGNDGLNTLVPFGDDEYYRQRPRIGVPNGDLLKLNDYLAFNKRAEGLMRLYQDGLLAAVQSVGYPNPDRSHFRSMEIWHTASDSDEFYGAGWIGRYFDNNCSGAARPHAGVAISGERPQAFEGDNGFGVAFTQPQRFGWREGRDEGSKDTFRELNRPSDAKASNLDFLRHVTSSAIMSSEEVQRAFDRGSKAKSDFRYGDPLAPVAQLIRGGLQTRIYYVSFGSFDTHANQRGQHETLLENFSSSLARFQNELKRDGLADRVVTMVFSEFGRRVGENASGGTDHGTAAPMFLVGEPVAAGLHGRPPSLDDLDDGDLKYNVDFRNVYASVLKDWFKADPAHVLLDTFQPLDLIT